MGSVERVSQSVWWQKERKPRDPEIWCCEDDGQLSALRVTDHTELRATGPSDQEPTTDPPSFCFSNKSEAAHFSAGVWRIASDPELQRRLNDRRRTILFWGTQRRRRDIKHAWCREAPVIHIKWIVWGIGRDFVQRDVLSRHFSSSEPALLKPFHFFSSVFKTELVSFLMKQNRKWMIRDVCFSRFVFTDADRRWDETLWRCF